MGAGVVRRADIFWSVWSRCLTNIGDCKISRKGDHHPRALVFFTSAPAPKRHPYASLQILKVLHLQEPEQDGRR